jgi:hypothetical protein
MDIGAVVGAAVGGALCLMTVGVGVVWIIRRNQRTADIELQQQLAALRTFADQWEAEARFYKSLANTDPALAYEVSFRVLSLTLSLSPPLLSLSSRISLSLSASLSLSLRVFPSLPESLPLSL